jgi:hypothetical protein
MYMGVTLMRVDAGATRQPRMVTDKCGCRYYRNTWRWASAFGLIFWEDSPGTTEIVE